MFDQHFDGLVLVVPGGVVQWLHLVVVAFVDAHFLQAENALQVGHLPVDRPLQQIHRQQVLVTCSQKYALNHRGVLLCIILR